MNHIKIGAFWKIPPLSGFAMGNLFEFLHLEPYFFTRGLFIYFFTFKSYQTNIL